MHVSVRRPAGCGCNSTISNAYLAFFAISSSYQYPWYLTVCVSNHFLMLFQALGIRVFIRLGNEHL